MEDTQEVFAQGVARLNEREYDAKVRKEPTEKEKAIFTCGACKFLMGMASHCPACGWERPKTRSDVRESAANSTRSHRRQGGQAAVVGGGSRSGVAPAFGYHALERKKGDVEAARKFASRSTRTSTAAGRVRSSTRERRAA
jgi:hypothetical protein